MWHSRHIVDDNLKVPATERRDRAPAVNALELVGSFKKTGYERTRRYAQCGWLAAPPLRNASMNE
jgi:hypothetical protein